MTAREQYNLVIKADVISKSHASKREPNKIKDGVINNRNIGNVCF